jgi:hypothetical protein
MHGGACGPKSQDKCQEPGARGRHSAEGGRPWVAFWAGAARGQACQTPGGGGEGGHVPKTGPNPRSGLPGALNLGRETLGGHVGPSPRTSARSPRARGLEGRGGEEGRVPRTGPSPRPGLPGALILGHDVWGGPSWHDVGLRPRPSAGSPGHAAGARRRGSLGAGVPGVATAGHRRRAGPGPVSPLHAVACGTRSTRLPHSLSPFRAPVRAPVLAHAHRPPPTLSTLTPTPLLPPSSRATQASTGCKGFMVFRV